VNELPNIRSKQDARCLTLRAGRSFAFTTPIFAGLIGARYWKLCQFPRYAQLPKLNAGECLSFQRDAAS